MKLKSLFLGMLGVVLFVGCNNESPIDGQGIEGDGISTHASFIIKFNSPTYAHGTDAGTTAEQAIDDVALFIYKLDGTPEAMIYATNSQFTVTPFTNGKITVKCKSGEKLIYLAANLGANGTPLSSPLVDFDYSGGAHADPWLGADWEVATNNPKQFATELNVPIWSTAAGVIAISSTLPTAITGKGTAEGLIKALVDIDFKVGNFL
jgi:hypothetical protein